MKNTASFRHLTARLFGRRSLLATTLSIMFLVNMALPAHARIEFQDDVFNNFDSDALRIGANDAGASNTAIRFGADATASENGNITWDITTNTFSVDHTVNITGGLSATGQVNFSTAVGVRLRESANPTTSAACTTVKELIVNTTLNRIEICTVTGSAGSATWVAIAGGDADTLDGLNSSQFMRNDASNTVTTGTTTFNAGTTLTANGAVNFTSATSFRPPEGAADPGTCTVGQIFYNTTSNSLKVCTSTNTWTTAVSGNGADLLDGLNGDQFLRSDTSDNFSSGTLTTDNGTTFAVNGIATFGDGGDAVSIDSNTWDISSAGVGSGFTGLSSSGTVSSTGTLSATGGVNFSGSTAFRIRENSDPNTNSACASVGEMIFNTTSNQLMRCTTIGIAGVATWTNVDTTGGSSDFEAVYTNDADKVLTTSNGDFTVSSGTGDTIVDSNDWNVTAAGSLDAASITSNGALAVTGTTNLNGAANLNGTAIIGDNGDTVTINSSDWDVSATGNMTGIGSIGADGLITGTAGATLSGATTNINANSNFTTNIGTGTTTSQVSVGGGSNCFQIDSNTWDISCAGVASGLTGLTSTGTINFSTATAFRPPEAAADPGACTVGQIFFNTTSNALKVCSSTNTWTIIGSANGADLLDGLDSTQFLRSDTSDNFSSGTLTLDDGTTLTVNGIAVIGDNGDDISINSNDWDISSAGVASGFTGITSSGTVSSTGTLTATGAVNLSASTAFRIRENSDPNTNSACASIGELIFNTTSNQLMRCTTTGIAGVATWTNVDTTGGTSDFEAVYANDADKILTTSNGNFTVDAGSGTVTVTGSTNINVSNGSATTNIATGTTTGAVTIGGTGTQTIAIGNGAGDKTVNVGSSNTTSTTTLLSGSGGILLNDSNNQVTNIGTGTSTGQVSLGGNSNCVQVDSNTWDISCAGVASGLTGITSTGTINFSGSSSFRVHEAASDPASCTEGEIFYNTTSNQLKVCSATNTWVSASPGTDDATIFYIPEYKDGVVSADGSSNGGTLSVDRDGANNRNNYDFTATTTTAQDIDVVLSVQLPDDFSSFQSTPIQLQYRTDDTDIADAQIDVTVLDTANAAVTTAGATDLNGTSWSTASITFSGSPTFTAGGRMTITMKMQARKDGGGGGGTPRHAYLGPLILNYNRQ